MTGTAPRPTLDQVAAVAGVGRGTVSRVINGSSRVSATARAAVQAAVAELGYVPNRAARSLVTRRTDSVALVVSESEERVFAEPFFARIVRGISAELMDTPLQLWLAMVQSPAERERITSHLTDQHVDGVMLLSLHDADPLPQLLATRGLPTVIGGRPATAGSQAEAGVDVVDVDNVGGARLAVSHLRQIGRSRLATVAGPQDMGAGVARLQGFRDGVTEIDGEPHRVAIGDFSEASGAAAMAQLLAAHPDLDGVFVASDLMAAGALRALVEAGRRVPDDVAVVGYEDSPVAQRTEPPLTTVHQPVEDMGRRMARLLADRILDTDDAIAPTSPVLLTTHLVRRAST